MTRFAEAAGALAGQAGALLGWRPVEFWAATPAELAAVLDALVPPGPTPAAAADLHQLWSQFPDG